MARDKVSFAVTAGSNSTVARRVAKLTLACVTPACFVNAAVTVDAQPAHVIPLIGKSTLVALELISAS